MKLSDLKNEEDVQLEENTQPEDNGTQAERTFTQEEVNRIVSERLARERSKSEPTPEEQKSRELDARESQLDCKEFLINNNYPTELIDVIDTSNTEEFKIKAKKINDLINRASRRPITPPFIAYESSGNSEISGAFAPGIKHKPKDF